MTDQIGVAKRMHRFAMAVRTLACFLISSFFLASCHSSEVKAERESRLVAFIKVLFEGANTRYTFEASDRAAALMTKKCELSDLKNLEVGDMHRKLGDVSEITVRFRNVVNLDQLDDHSSKPSINGDLPPARQLVLAHIVVNWNMSALKEFEIDQAEANRIVDKELSKSEFTLAGLQKIKIGSKGKLLEELATIGVAFEPLNDSPKNP